MAKKLQVGTYRFDASEKVVYIQGNIQPEKVLLITNITDNTIIYNFANANLGFAGKSYNQTNDETEFNLVYDTTSMSDTDVLQIFTDMDYQEITPAEDMLDPVGKMRVSNPANLIDTDFEYGLQSTKWETLQTVNNIPTIFSNTGDTPVDGIVSVDAVNGSKNVKVTCSLNHGLSIGDAVSVQGLSQYQAEGFFIVTSVPTTLTFFFELDVPANFSGDISGSYTTIIAGKFFEGSTLPVSTSDGAVTDGGSPASNITVTTSETHGFSTDTKVYLRNTVGPKLLKIADSTATAPDGRPFVDITPTFSSANTINQATSTARGGFREPALIPYDWESLWTKYLVPGDINTGADTVTWNNHTLRNGYTLLFNTPKYQLSDAGLTDGTVYYVEVVDANSIKLHTSDALSSAVNLTTLNNTYGLARLGLVYKVEGTAGTTRYTEAYQANSATASGYSGDFFTTSTGSLTSTVNLTSLFGTNPTNVSILNLQLRGDVNSSGEWVRFNIAGNTQFTYSPGNQSWNYGSCTNQSGGATVFDGLDVTSAMYLQNGNYYIDIVSDCSSSVGGFTNTGNYRYGFRVNFQNTSPPGQITESGKRFSGGDLYDSQYGLGGVQPTRVIAFQSRDANTTGQSTEDAFSYLVNQRFAGRYGTIGGKYSNVVSVTNAQSQTGSFTIDFTDSVTTYSTSSEYFYIFARDLTSDRNTLFINNHGIEDGTVVNLQVDATRYAAGDRFAFASSTSAVTQIGTQNVSATVAVVNQDVIRLTLNTSPNTDDIVECPAIFSLNFVTQNRTYNTIYVNNHKVTADASAIYTNVTGNVIPPITDGQSVVLKRVDDSRLEVTGSLGGSQGQQTYVVEYFNNSTQSNLFVDIETALGFTPTAATITQIEFRGDFSSSSEYLDLTFSDNDAYVIGNPGSDSSSYTTVPVGTFGGKDISSILQTQNGKVGFVATYDPTSVVNYGPGGGPWWGLRFTIDANSTSVVMTGQGTGAHSFDVSNLVGAYDGVFNITSIPNANEFVMASDFQIPQRTYTFTNTDVDNAAETITFSSDHNLVTGEKITYSEGANTSILPTGAANPLYVIVASSTAIRLATSVIDALNNISLNITGQTGTHTITSENVIKSATGPGTMSITNGSKAVVGTGTNFLQRFKRFDKVYIDIGTYVKEFSVDGITTPTNMTLFEDPGTTQASTNYYFATQLALRPDGFQLHKPFDGGVDITAGTSPNSRICRQTRKYFRYQSGKGIQTSFAINFNPPRVVRELIKASGTTATVKTQEQHNLSVNDSITITGAQVNTGQNTYNGTFPVATIPNPFEFTYTMSSAPSDIKASGFPKYVRAGWTDSFVRAGMFDDQNGMFYEYDGQKLYAVRRSSTLQLAGSVNVTRGSQVVNGTTTSFTTQLVVGNSVVIRGQTYKIVEVSSDIRLVVQPAYRGVDGTGVKITKTIDTRTAQENWNIDKADGTGFTGYILDTTKIQMAYIDYSWYGAGKIRYGFKDRLGHIKYFHEYRHNNVLDESYFRSGNLPSRYEIANGPNSTTAPTLFHFGTSVIMDGEFDDDKAYQFSGQSQPMSFANGTNNNYASTANSTFEQITLDGKRVFVYAFQCAAATAQAVEVGMPILHNGNTTLPSPDTYISQILIDGANSKIFTSYPATLVDPTGGATYPVIASGQTFDIGEPTTTDLTQFLPLISCRLAPSVDSALTGVLGEREVLNRMQLRLRQASVTSNVPCEIFIIQNPLPSALLYQNAQSPSLAQIIKHRVGDTLLNGTTIFAQKSPAGTTTVDLTQLLEIGNSILGGDGIYPAGPDLLTVAVQPQNTSTVSFANPLLVSGNLGWSESQA